MTEGGGLTPLRSLTPLACRRVSSSSSTTRIVLTSTSVNTVDAGEISLFSSLSSQWWNEHGEFRFLHSLNPPRIAFLSKAIRDEGLLPTGSADPNPTAAAAATTTTTAAGKAILANPSVVTFRGLRILDIGCGGGILTEVRALSLSLSLLLLLLDIVWV